jgi:hypothetical protein
MHATPSHSVWSLSTYIAHYSVPSPFPPVFSSFSSPCPCMPNESSSKSRQNRSPKTILLRSPQAKSPSKRFSPTLAFLFIPPTRSLNFLDRCKIFLKRSISLSSISKVFRATFRLSRKSLSHSTSRGRRWSMLWRDERSCSTVLIWSCKKLAA